MNKLNRKYLLKPDRSLQNTFNNDRVTNDNITDKMAEKLLLNHPALIKHFQVITEQEQNA